MRFAAGVAVGMLFARPIVKRVTRPIHPYLKDRALAMIGACASSIADTCDELLKENNNR